MIHVCAEAGSTHMGKLDKIKALIEGAKAAGADSIKFQLFPNIKEYTGCGNVYMSKDLFTKAFRIGLDVGIPVTASIFGKEESDFIKDFDVPYVKFGYSMRNSSLMDEHETVVVTTDIMETCKRDDAVKLYTVTVNGQVVYPVTQSIHFEGLFPRYDGFSDHTLGIYQAERAVISGATWFEKHVRPDQDMDCPDARFAIDLDELKDYVEVIKCN